MTLPLLLLLVRWAAALVAAALLGHWLYAMRHRAPATAMLGGALLALWVAAMGLGLALILGASP